MEKLPTTATATAYPTSVDGSFGDSNLAVDNVAIDPSVVNGGGKHDESGGDQIVGVVNNHGHEQNGSSSGGGVQFKKGPWTAMEDAILIEHVNTHGEGNWNSVYRCTGLARCGKSCRLRWSNHLRPNLKKGAFSPEEERFIVESHALFGNKWARMAVLLPGRTDNEIKNYWNTRVKRHQRLGIPLYPPHIKPVHHEPPPKRGPQRRNHLQCPPYSATSPQSFTFQTQLPSPTSPSYNPLFNNNPTSPISPLRSPLSSPTTPISKPLFPASSAISPHHSPLPSPRTAPLQAIPHLQSPMASPAASSSPIPCPFTFQTQPLNPPTNHPPIPTPPTTSTPTTPTPISSPSTTSTTSLPFFNFSIPPRAPPTLVQSPLRFRRFPSFSLSPITTPTTTTTSTTDATVTPFSLPFQRFSQASIPNEAPSTATVSPHENPRPSSSVTQILATSTSSIAFQKEMEEENKKLRSLLADITHLQQQRQQLEQLPSIQFLPPRNSNHGVGFWQQLEPASTQFLSQTKSHHHQVERLQKPEAPSIHFLLPSSDVAIATSATTSATTSPSPNFDKRGTNKRKNWDGEEGSGRDGREQEQPEEFLFMEDLLEQERGDNQGWSGKTGHLVIDQDDQDKHDLFDGLPGTWNHFDSFSQCPGMGPSGESTSELNITIPEDLTSLVNSMTFPTDTNTHSHTGGASGDRSPVIMGEKNDVLEMHQIASLFNSSADHDRAATIDTCSWENLSEICR